MRRGKPELKLATRVNHLPSADDGSVVVHRWSGMRPAAYDELMLKWSLPLWLRA
jgi:hypothetical protein